DVSAEAVVIAGDAHGGRWAQRQIETELHVAASVPAIDAVAAELDESFLQSDLGLVRDVAHGSRQGAGAEQRALRTAQHLDAIRVEQIEVWREEGERDDRLVEIDADLLFHTWLVSHDLAGGDAAHGDLALAGPEVLHGESADVCRDPLNVVDAAA